MGGSASQAAEAEKAEAMDNLGSIMTLLRNKVESMELELEQQRGQIGDSQTSAVSGGRTVQHLSVIRCAASTHIDSEISNAIDHFFDAAQGAVAGEDDKKSGVSAVEGAKSLVKAGLSALFGVKNGQSMERESFVCLYLNNSFVRVDYKAYSYSASAKKWGIEANQCGACYVCDLSVLDIDAMNPSEIDFLVSQAFAFRGSKGIDLLQAFKMKLVQNNLLSRMIFREDATFEGLQEAATQLASNRKELLELTKQLDDNALQIAYERARIQYDYYCEQFLQLNDFNDKDVTDQNEDVTRERFDMALNMYEASLSLEKDFKQFVHGGPEAEEANSNAPGADWAAQLDVPELVSRSEEKWVIQAADPNGPDSVSEHPLMQRFHELKWQGEKLGVPLPDE